MAKDGFHRKTYPPGARIFREGEPGQDAYLIERGRVEISANRQGADFFIASLGPGELFGEMALIDNQVRTATATALEQTEVASISRDQLQKKMEKADPVLALLLRVILKRLRWSLHRVLEHEPGVVGAEEQISTEQDRVLKNARDHAISQIKLVEELELAIKRRDFELYYQPIVSCQDGHTAGFEALIRWRHPERGLLFPMNFINTAEDTGLIVPMGLWALEQACWDLLRLQEAAPPTRSRRSPLFVSVNLSASQLQNADEVSRLIDVLKKVGTDPASVKLEITESLLIENPDLSSRVLSELKELGVTLAIDDFGTGYSSLSYLHRFPLDTLKVDRSFVETMLENYGSLQVVRAVVGLAQELGMDIVAEGVGSAEQLSRLRELGCAYAQGFLVSEPLTIGDALQFLAQGRVPLPGLAGVRGKL